MIACLIYLTITLFIPLRLTYLTLKGKNDKQSSKLWAVYWAIYTFINLFTWMIPFLTYQPFQFLWMVLLLWVYQAEYKGGLLISQIFDQFVSSQPPLKTNINMLKQKLVPLGIFEIQQQKSKLE